MDQAKILIVDDDPFFRESLKDVLTDEGYLVSEAGDGITGRDQVLNNGHVDLVLLDLDLPRLSGMDVLKVTSQSRPELPVIIISGTGSIPVAVQATQLGAYDFIEKDDDPRKTLIKVRNAIEKSRLIRERNHLVADQRERYRMVGTSAAMQEIFSMIDKAARNSSKVLVTGDTGTGKELIARAIHNNSERAGGPFVAVNCAAIPENLIESELFGFEKGAFTGATVRKKGKFESAHGGTLFLDEIGDTSLMMQAKILRAIEDGVIERLGAERPVQVDVRIISATNKDLEAEIAEGNFREDLYWRLNVIPVSVAPLFQRRGDIPDLVAHFIDEFSRMENLPKKSIKPGGMRLLVEYDWPGNIRQVRNVMERLVVLSDGDSIDTRDIATALKKTEAISLEDEYKTLRDAREQFERDYIQSTLLAFQNNIQETASALGIDRTHLWKKMRRYDIKTD